MGILSDRLPKYSGQYEVGVIDLELPVEKRRLSEMVLKESGAPAFDLETVLFSLYYPAPQGVHSRRSQHRWMPDPMQHAAGYARAAKVSCVVADSVLSAALYAFAGSTTIPAKVDVPLDNSSQVYFGEDTEELLESYDLPKFPVIIFSHGMLSSRTSYSQLLGELASRGYVVAAIEHRDGSAPATTVRAKGSRDRTVGYIAANHLNPEPDREELKRVQLAMRQAEVEETVRALHQINDGLGAHLKKLNQRKEGIDLVNWTGRLNMDRVVIAGHSYGATLALQALKDSPSEKFPFVGGIVLDAGKCSGRLNDSIDVPILVVNTQSWSSKTKDFYGKPHFEVVKALVEMAQNPAKGKFAWFVTSKGTSHPSMTDAPLIEPTILSWATGSQVNALEGVLEYVKISDDFVQFLGDGQRRGVLAQDVTHSAFDQDIRSAERKANFPPEIEKFWQIHACPSASHGFIDKLPVNNLENLTRIISEVGAKGQHAKGPNVKISEHNSRF